MSAPDPREPGPYGIGSDHWPGVGKVIEEMNELGTVLGKLFGSGGAREHWSGDLINMMQDEMADVWAAFDFLIEANPDFRLRPEWGRGDGIGYIVKRRQWKFDLFQSWHRGDPPEAWPRPEDYGLPPRPTWEPDQCPACLGRTFANIDGAEAVRCVSCKRVFERHGDTNRLKREDD